MVYRAGDLAVLLADFGTAWRFAGEEATGIFDDADEVRAHDEGFEVVGKVRSVLFRASDFASLVVGSTLEDVEEAVTYTVRDIQREGRDAAFKRVVLVEAVS